MTANERQVTELIRQGENLALEFKVKTAVVYRRRKGRKEIQIVMNIKRLTSQVKDIS